MSHPHFVLDPKLESLLAEYATGAFDGDSALSDLGLDSLALVRTVVRYVPDEDQEIDAAALGSLRTVADLQRWLDELVAGGVR